MADLRRRAWYCPASQFRHRCGRSLISPGQGPMVHCAISRLLHLFCGSFVSTSRRKLQCGAANLTGGSCPGVSPTFEALMVPRRRVGGVPMVPDATKCYQMRSTPLCVSLSKMLRSAGPGVDDPIAVTQV